MRIHSPGSIQFVDCDDFSVDIMTFHGFYRLSHLRKMATSEEAPSRRVGVTLIVKNQEREGSLLLTKSKVFSTLTFSSDINPSEDEYIWVFENEVWQQMKPWVHSFFS